MASGKLGVENRQTGVVTVTGRSGEGGECRDKGVGMKEKGGRVGWGIASGK